MRSHAVGLSHNVNIVEAVERYVQLAEELERGPPLHSSGGAVVRTAQPRPVKDPAAEHIRARPAEAVPEARRQAQLIFHALAGNDPVLVVEAVAERIAAGLALEGDLRDGREKICHAHVPFRDAMAG
jgi:hypothetical protein